MQAELFDVFRRPREEGVQPVRKEDVAEVLRRRFFEHDSLQNQDAQRAHVMAVVQRIAALDETRPASPKRYASWPAWPPRRRPKGAKTDWATLLDAELQKARQIQTELLALATGREAEQAVIAVFLHSQPTGHGRERCAGAAEVVAARQPAQPAADAR